MAHPEYQRLTRSRSRRFFSPAVRSRVSLALGRNHLLFIDTNGYTESYKRFYFRDIQALTLQTTNAANIINIVLTLFMVLFGILGLLASSDVPLRIFLFICGGIFGFFLLLNLLRGQTCRCYLRTAVQTEELSSLHRVRQAQKIFARLQPLIVAAQGGEATPEMIAAQLAESFPAPVLAPVAGEAAPPAAPAPPDPAP